ncbi:hypothetical protein HHL25_00585 [Rhizobium sp. S-51]|uniref:DUF2291 domain-containing protein n=1 Tax=Rhizobium terricola TaxID=2728849 RepID=A0A7Y0ASC4_9HYPH|nr:hypothetical protein [Rhizobium terricola]NML72610.1 hypothetical protein [Rhizobium terricola]
MATRKAVLAATMFALSMSHALAQTAEPNAKALVTPAVLEDMRKFIDSEIVQISIDAQNEKQQKLTQAEIDTLDAQWRAEREKEDKPLIAATLSNPLSVYLARIQGRSLGLYAEIFVMDQNGLNVGQSSVTSDFWQGDEDKFQKTFNVAGDAVFIDAPEWDDEAKIWRGQVSFTVTKGAEEKPIGAVTVELNLTELERRAAVGL